MGDRLRRPGRPRRPAAMADMAADLLSVQAHDQVNPAPGHPQQPQRGRESARLPQRRVHDQRRPDGRALHYQYRRPEHVLSDQVALFGQEAGLKTSATSSPPRSSSGSRTLQGRPSAPSSADSVSVTSSQSPGAVRHKPDHLGRRSPRPRTVTATQPRGHQVQRPCRLVGAGPVTTGLGTAGPGWPGSARRAQRPLCRPDHDRGHPSTRAARTASLSMPPRRPSTAPAPPHRSPGEPLAGAALSPPTSKRPGNRCPPSAGVGRTRTRSPPARTGSTNPRK